MIFGIHRQRAGDGDALLLPAGEFRRVDVGFFGNADLIQLLAGDGFGFVFSALADDLLRQHHVAEHRQIREQVERLENHPDFFADLIDIGRFVGEVDAIDPDFALVNGLKPVDAAQQRAFPRSARSDDDDDFARSDFEADVIESMDVPEMLGRIVDADDRR